MPDYNLLDLKISVILAMITFTSSYAVWILRDYPPVIFYYCFRRHLLSGLITGAAK